MVVSYRGMATLYLDQEDSCTHPVLLTTTDSGVAGYYRGIATLYLKSGGVGGSGP